MTTQFQLTIKEWGMPFINFLDAMSGEIKSEIILLLSHQKGDSSFRMLTLGNWSYFVYLFSDFIFVFQVKVELDLNARQKSH